MNQSALQYKTIPSPVGPLCLVASEKGLAAIEFGPMPGKTDVPPEPNETNPHLLRAEKQLGEYFAGKRREFDLKLDLRGTIFQLKAWKELRKIPYGETISYGEQARRVGDPKKARAMGMANGRNPIPIIVPCHRVIGESGALTGFSGGLHNKTFLLTHEAAA